MQRIADEIPQGLIEVRTPDSAYLYAQASPAPCGDGDPEAE